MIWHKQYVEKYRYAFSHFRSTNITVSKLFKFIETGGFMSLLFHLIYIYFSGIFRFYFVSLNQNRMCYPRISAFLAKGRFCVCRKTMHERNAL